MRALTLLVFLSLFSAEFIATADAQEISSSDSKPNGKRIRRQLNLIVGLSHDEELLIPDKETVLKGRTDFFDVVRISGTDYFRITPKKAGSGIATLHDKKTGQILVELRFDIRDDSVERTLREVQALLADIEGVEYKIINTSSTPGTAPTILLDGFVLLPKDLIRIFQVISNYEPGRIKSLVTLSPIARQKIADFITRDVNNPEVKISAVGNFIKLEGQVNNQQEKDRIKNIVSLYLPDIVTEKAPGNGSESVQITGRKQAGTVDDMIIDLISIRPAEEKIEPPPKLVQIVAHFVKFNDGYNKAFNFKFSPSVSTQAGVNGQQPSTGTGSSFDSTINLLNNLLPKLNWSRFHGFAKILDTASILVQDRNQGKLDRKFSTNVPQVINGVVTPAPVQAGIVLSVTPIIKSERSGLVELNRLTVSVGSGNKNEPSSTTDISTTISVRDRQSAAFAGIIKKSTDTEYGAPTTEQAQAIISFNASKSYDRANSQFVVFVTPIIKSSASTGVEQVKKKFRLRD